MRTIQLPYVFQFVWHKHSPNLEGVILCWNNVVLLYKLTREITSFWEIYIIVWNNYYKLLTTSPTKYYIPLMRFEFLGTINQPLILFLMNVLLNLKIGRVQLMGGGIKVWSVFGVEGFCFDRNNTVLQQYVLVYFSNCVIFLFCPIGPYFGFHRF